MTVLTHPEFNANTEAVEVAKAFADGIRGKNILVTGPNLKGIGFTTCQGFASQSPANLILAGRNPAKVQECIDALKAEYPQVTYSTLVIDLSSQESVRAAASELLSWADVPQIDILVNSAGVAAVPKRTITNDGVELHLATNHVGHWLLVNLIMPKLVKSAESSPRGATRIVNVSSGSPMVSSFRWSDILYEKKSKDLPEVEQPAYQFLTFWGYSNIEDSEYIPVDAYNRSKVANVLFSIGANKRFFEKHGILSIAVHPGVIETELVRDAAPETVAAIGEMMKKGLFTYKSLAAGSSTSLVAALDPKVGVDATNTASENHGVFLEDCQVTDKANPLAVSSSEAEKLWKLSEKLAKQEFA